MRDNKDRTAVLVVSVVLSAPTTEEAENRAAGSIAQAFSSELVSGRVIRIASHIGGRVIYPRPAPVSAEDKVEEARRLLVAGDVAGATEILSRK